MSKIDDWKQKDKLVLLEGWARNGLTDEQIAHNIGIARTTLYDWKKKSSDITNSLKKGKEIVDFEVENALLKNALEGNTTAQIFWLKNRISDRWRDKIINDDDEKDIKNAKDIIVKIKKAVENE
ncbi:MAG: hypothetical protein KBT03_03710 [Bacteroidales bacterium]|nr:hypothetical protein [Candidatus Scybalousia scybalohippi]